MSDSFDTFLAEHRARVEPLERASGDAWWHASVRSSPEADARAAATQKALTRLYADRDAFARVSSAFDASAFTADDRRQWVLVRNAFAGNQMDDAAIEEMIDTERRIESAYNNFRPLFRGTPTADNALRDVLRDSDDPGLRRDAWEASKEIGTVVRPDVLRLVELRNREARRLGYRDYYRMSLDLQELDEAALFALLERTAEQTANLYAAYKSGLDRDLAARFGIQPPDLRPWHYGDPFFQEAPDTDADLDRFFADRDLARLTGSFFGAIGLDIADLLSAADLYERPGKCQHAFCVHVGRYEDVRVLCNCTPTERWMGTMLHEFGHAVYDKYLGDDLPFFLRDVAHILTTEAIAMLMGRLSRNGAFLQRYAGASADEARAVEAAAAREQAAQLLIFSRWCQVMVRFEQALYADPDQDLSGLWWDLVEKYQYIRRPGGRAAPDWAAKIHIATSPVYYHNYLLGEMFASQLLDFLRTHVVRPESGDAGLVSDPAVGAYLRREIFARGARLRWDDLIAASTGEPLNPAHFVAHLRV
jgi:peptidyl-dipeptidase A